ncbi:hypothetical protein [Rhodococcus rhodochrous]|uniref:hypothetical protein n=1 Tax=Rhodococcus rhodochrous TaxID=1829 RepID=UPI00177D423F|nr:hypothetical protein [Rhodococcus rhodochrous]QOH55220.1 hypothetical protein C6Y44_03975 [Rhodococcus rhodochrous]
MTLALHTPSDTPIFDTLTAHFFPTPTDTEGRSTVIDVQVLAVRDTALDDAKSVGDTARPEFLKPALWILTLGTAIGTLVWLYITLTTGVF